MLSFLRQLWILFALLGSVLHPIQAITLSVALRDNLPILSSTRVTNSVVRLESSSDLQTWHELGLFEDRIAAYRDTSPGATRYYRAHFLSGQNPVYANQLDETGWSSLKWGGLKFQVSHVKFVIDLAQPGKVYFHQAPLHYDFVSQHLPGYQGISVPEFDQIALSTQSQKLLLGTILFQPIGFSGLEYGIQFVGRDPYPVDFIVNAFRTVQERMVLASPRPAFYFPDQEQASFAEQNRAAFLAAGIEVSSLGRWNVLDSTYSKGWAIGTLKFYPLEQVDAAWASGALSEKDILLTDFVPADLPSFAGIISLHPSSPGSHVSILAQADRRPYAYLATPFLRERAQSLVGKTILFRAGNPGARLEALYPGAPGSEFIKIMDITGQYETITNQLAALLQSAPLRYPAKQTTPALTADVDNLTLADIKYFGGKAANFGLLRRTIPQHSPKAIAFSFNLWDQFMMQEYSPGRSFRDEIASRLSRLSVESPPFVWASELDSIRTLIRNGRFPPETQQQVLAALTIFDSERNIRFRSSSNVEDGETFTAAGLYDSYSGCVADDLDPDSRGPSLCDPTEDEERGVFRAIKKVFASFYNEQAYRERVRRGVLEDEVGMALLVHESFPDEIEFLNGVVIATWQKSSFAAEPFISLRIVAQKGAVSVANPDSGAVPEIVEIAAYNRAVSIRQYSSLMPFGVSVFEYSEVQRLGDLIDRCAFAYASLFPEKQKIVLDFEFKRIPSGLVIKQIRPVPTLDSMAVSPLAINEPNLLATAQSWPGDVFSSHYLKSQWTLEVTPFLMTTQALSAPFYSRVSLQLHENGRIRAYEGPLHTLPQYSHSFTNNIVRDAWSFEPGGPLYTLTTHPAVAPFSPEKQIQTITDWELELSVIYPRPKLAIICTNTGSSDFLCSTLVVRTNTFMVSLSPVLQVSPNSLPVYRIWNATNDLQVRSDYYWVRRPETSFGPTGFTSPLLAWKASELTGFTATPFTLRGFFSQTYSSRRKNLTETFILDPWLEPGISPEILQQLEQAGIRKIFIGAQLGLITPSDEIHFLPVQMSGHPIGWW